MTDTDKLLATVRDALTRPQLWEGSRMQHDALDDLAERLDALAERLAKLESGSLYMEHTELLAQLAHAEAHAERFEKALREMLRLVDAHERWCGYNKDAPGDSIINRAPELARAVLDEKEEA